MDKFKVTDTFNIRNRGTVYIGENVFKEKDTKSLLGKTIKVIGKGLFYGIVKGVEALKTPLSKNINVGLLIEPIEIDVETYKEL